ncbi:hypothetical protein ACPA2N_25755 [Ectopseudomonas hydrolytica]|uniref:hypothetical protein n=1 Tax=Ectopseudomonas hydrolytica TaxID=2493633 RepID=UPI003C2BE15A
MLQNPHYHSHAEQQAALGCAAVLDPIKHPRRYAKQQAREKFKPLKRNNQPGSPKTPPDILAKAKALTHLHITEAARQLGVSRSVLERLRCDYGLAFSAPTYGKAAERLMALAGDHPTMKGLAAAADLSYCHTYRLCKLHGIEPGVPYGQAPEGT